MGWLRYSIANLFMGIARVQLSHRGSRAKSKEKDKEGRNGMEWMNEEHVRGGGEHETERGEGAER